MFRSAIIFSLIISCLTSIAQLSGTYTIDQGNPTSGTNFASFAAAASALNANGVSGAVTINVATNSGPYTDQFSIDSVSGLSATNTLTINGNGNRISHFYTTGKKQTIRINGCPYVTIDNLIVEINSISDGIGIHVFNGSDHSVVRNCELDLDSMNTNSSFDVAAIVVNGSDLFSFGSGFTDSVTIENNTIYGGPGGAGYAIKVIGGGFPTTTSSGHIIRNNTVYDPGYWGILLEYVSNCLVSGNDISRPIRTTGDFLGIGIFSSTANVIVEKNRVHNSHGSNAGSTDAFGIRFNNSTPTSAQRNLVRNNLIYDFNGTGSSYGIHCFSSNNVDFYHNTVSLDYTAATNGNAYGYYHMGSLSNVDFINNIISITKGGSGTKYGYYFSGGSPVIDANNNVLYVNSQGSGSNYTAYWNSTNYSSLSSWQSASSGAFDSNSVDADPLFVSISGSNYRASSALVDDIGQPLTLVPSDIINIPRSLTTPDPGAYETAPPKLDVGVVSIDSLEASCPGSVPVYATIKNFGLDTIQSVTVNWSLNGSAQTPIALSTNLTLLQSTSVFLGNVTLTASNSIDITAFTTLPNGQADTINSNDTSSILNFRSALSGTYTIGNTGDYPTLLAAANDLNIRGICGTVYMNVDSASGPFTDQFILYDVPGSSPADSIVFNGNGALIDFNVQGKEFHVIRFDNAHYMTFRDFSINVLGSNSDDGGGIVFTNGTSHIRIENCEIDLGSTQATSFNTGVILFLGEQNTSPVADFCSIVNCHLIASGVRNGILVEGNSSNTCYGLQLVNNIIEDIFFSGVYMTYSDSCLIKGNDISRKGFLVNWTFRGMYLYEQNENALIYGNRIHNPSDQDNSITVTCIGIDLSNADAPSGKENKIINNLIYKFNNRGLHVGINNMSSSGMHAYHNTVVLDDNNGGGGQSWAFHQQNSATNLILKNNLFVITRNGSGLQYAYYLQSGSGGMLLDYNGIYTDTLNNRAFAVKRNNANFKTLTDWVNSSASGINDANSVFDAPRFLSQATDDYTPFSCRLNGIGEYLGVSEDIDYTLRDTVNPDPGAIAFDVSFTSVQLGEDTTVCIDKTFQLRASAGLNSYQWSTGGSSQVESIYALDLGYGDTVIYVYATDSIGCASSDSLVVTVEDCIPSGLEEAENVANVEVFPNPATDVLNIRFPKHALIGALSIRDARGVEVFRLNNNSTINHKIIQVPVRKFTPGIYLLFVNDNQNFTTKIIIQ